MANLAEAMPHGDLQEVFTDVFFVTGTSRPTFMGASWQYSRNMTVVRAGSELTLINSVRLDAPGLAQLDALGEVKHVVRLGSFHGMDDAFYRARYGARQWALPGMDRESGCAPAAELVPGGETPVPGCDVFVFETSIRPEGILHLDREGGVLISCDSLQNWRAPDTYFSSESAARMTEMGFIQAANIGPGWRLACQPAARDFVRLEALRFRHLLPAHGTPLLGDAHEQLAARFEKEFGI